jgi:tetratricopeptide (TPR) repeat protein
VVYANRAMALLKINDNVRAEEDCTKTIELDDTFIKAWQRRGAARKAMCRYREAVEDLEYALR